MKSKRRRIVSFAMENRKRNSFYEITYHFTHASFLQWTILLLLNFSFLKKVSGAGENGALKEFCQFDAFEANCYDDEVILMQRAHYGRMRSGRCITGEGYIGCDADVLMYLDALCSGRQTCSVKVTEIADVVRPCKRDYAAYMEASYICQKVVSGSSNVCHPGHGVTLHSHHSHPAYLSNFITDNTGYGSASCPWKIKVDGGQNVRFSLLEFGVMVRGEDNSWKRFDPQKSGCPIHAIFVEHNSIEERPLCGEGKREWVVYRSTTSQIEVHFNNMEIGQETPMFLMKYEVSGCPKLVPPPHAYVRFEGENAIIKCNFTEETWYITCSGTAWMGNIGNCSDTGSDWPVQDFFGTSVPFPQGLIIAVFIGVALGIVLGTVLLSIVLIHRKKKQKCQAKREAEYAYSSARDTGATYPCLLKQQDLSHNSEFSHIIDTPSGAREEKYSRDGLNRPLVYAGESQSATNTYGPKHHVYECPTIPGAYHERAMGPNHETPVYYDIDPEQPGRYKKHGLREVNT